MKITRRFPGIATKPRYWVRPFLCMILCTDVSVIQKTSHASLVPPKLNIIKQVFMLQADYTIVKVGLPPSYLYGGRATGGTV